MTDYDDGNAREIAANLKQRDAARAMLAALKAMSAIIRPHSPPCGCTACKAAAAIAQAEAAGIKAVEHWP